MMQHGVAEYSKWTRVMIAGPEEARTAADKEAETGIATGREIILPSRDEDGGELEFRLSQAE